MRKYKVGSTKYNEEEFINKFARKWNYKLQKYTKGFAIIGWINLEYMFRVFLRAYKWRNE